MEQREKIGVPNLDFSHKTGVVSLSLQKLEGGYFLRENHSGKKYPISGFGLVADLVTSSANHLVQRVQQVADNIKIGEVFTIELQVKKGLSPLFNLYAGNGLHMIDNIGGWRPINWFGHQMQQVAMLCNVGPDFLEQFKQDNDGWIAFMKSPEIRNNPNLSRPTMSNFMGNHNPFSYDDPFAFAPIMYGDQEEKPNTSDVRERRSPSGEIKLD